MIFEDYVLAVLVGEHHQEQSATLSCIEHWRLSEFIAVDIVINHKSRLDYFTFLEEVRERHPGKHLIVMHADIHFPEDFLHRLVQQIAMIEGAGASWGILGPAGVCYPYFKIVRNIVDCHGILYPFSSPLPAVHLDGLLLVIHKDLVFDFDPEYRGFHHYDTLLCIRSWEQGLPAFVICLPLHHLGQGNVEEWQQQSEIFGTMLGKVYGNKSLVTIMGNVPLNGAPGVQGDFYGQKVHPVLARWAEGRKTPDVVLVVQVDTDDENEIKQTMLSVTGQFEKPELVIVLIPAAQSEQVAPILEYFGQFIRIVSLVGKSNGRTGNGDVFMGCPEEIRNALPEHAVVSFLTSRTTLFPNFVRDIHRFYRLGINVQDVVAALDFNYAVRPADGESTTPGCETLVGGWRTETAEDLLTGGELPLESLAVPATLVRSVLDDHLHGALTERVFEFKIIAKAQVFFLRRLGGLVRVLSSTSPSSDRASDAMAVHADFLRSHYPRSLWDKYTANDAVPLTKEEMLAEKFMQYPRLVAAIFRVHGWIKRICTK
ncbi:hypothetical protein [uncultured Pseudodesulfovibrio sp.]|uniref:hypothetical protein n=1 Tax=uncultured Pseudodesulfovibrio sp. TaxID=2035858 RepID=UPI0029C8E9CE|nr:hypothetical protein [uncultured Pseudodesulfovibrio sp.]